MPAASWVSAGSGAAAWSSRVMVRSVNPRGLSPLAPPMSESTRTFAPVGPTRRMSKSSGKAAPLAVHWKPFSVRFTSVTVPVSPDTSMGEG